MNKLLIIFLILFCSSTNNFLTAQVIEPNPLIFKTASFSTKSTHNKVLLDTAGLNNTGTWLPEFAPNDTVVYLAYQNGGWLYGTNNSANNYTKIAQGYKNNFGSIVGVKEILFWIAGKTYNSLDTNSKVEVALYTLDNNTAANDNGGGNWSFNSKGPGSKLTSKVIQLSTIDTSFQTFNVVTLDSVHGVNDFAIVIDFSSVKQLGDEIGFLCDPLNSANNLDYAFHFSASVNAWFVSDYLFSQAQGGSGYLDNNIALFAVVDEDYVGINSNDFYNGIQMSAYPNPSSSGVIIAYNLKEPSVLEIFNSSGQLVFNKKIISLNSNIKVKALKPGTYYYSIKNFSGRLTKKLIILN
jgi:hypothetical protein